MNKTKPNLTRAAMTLLFAVLSSFMAVSTCFAATGSPTKGSCGPSDKPEAVLWEFNMATQTLTISGEGDMADFESPADAPWYNWLNDITSVVVADGVTHVSDYAFSSEYWQLNSLSMGSTVLSIGDYAFNGVPLKSIQQTKTENAARKKEEAADEPVASFLPDDLQTIGVHALSGTLITSLTIPADVNLISEGALSYNEKLTTLTCLGTMIVPWLDGDVLEGSPVTAIYVPDAAIDDYKNAGCWQQYTSLIKPVSEKDDESGEEPGGDEPTEPGTITIGSGDNWTDLPITAQYNYAVTQQVFSAEEINHGKGKIWSLAFKTHTGDLKRNLTVYLTHRDYASVSLHPVTEADQVFKGEVMFTAGQWNTIYFDRPFEYDGKSSIIVTVDDNTGTAEGWGSLQNYYFYGDGGHAIARDNNKDIDPLDEASIENANKRDSYQYKAQIQFTFGEYPVPASLTVNAGDVSAEVACTLRGDATAWNVRYRKVAKEGEEEQRYVAINDLTDLSTTLTDLTPATKYEVQVQAIFPEDNLSEWSDPVIFTTACCPVEQQVEIMFALGSQYIEWFGYAVQIVDVTDEANPVEVAYLQAPSYKAYSGTVTLCCEHKYQVNWIYDADKAVYSQSYYFSLYYPQGDLIYSMARGEAPEETAELTRFVMDCTDYCSQSPQALSVDNTTYNSATISFRSETQAGEVVYSTEAGFDPGTATPTSVSYEALAAKEDPWGGIPNNASLTVNGLDPLTKYYVRVRNVCTGGVGFSRWSDPVEVITGSRYDGPKIVSTEPVNSRSEKITFKNGGESTKVNLYYRAKVEGTPVSADAIQTIGSGKGKGFEKDTWGEGLWASGSEKPYSNILFVGGIGSNTAYSFNAGQGKTAADPEKFLYGMVEQTEATPLEQMKRLDYECMNDADKQARIKYLENQIKDLMSRMASIGNTSAGMTPEDEEALKSLQEQKDELEAEKKFLEASLLSSAERQEKIKDLENKIKDLMARIASVGNSSAGMTPEDEAFLKDLQDQKDELEAEKDALESATLNDADKLQKMKDLESSLEQSEKKINELMESLQKGEITEAQYDEQIKDLNEEYFGTSDELNNLRATMSAAQNMNKDGFTVLSGADTNANAPKARTRADEGKKYVFFIRHSNGDGWLLVNNLTFTPNDKLNAWTVVPNVTGSEYTITGLEPETTYEVMVEPIFDSGLTGTQSPIASFTTIGEETDPVEGEFSVSGEKKVQFAKGNLRYEGDSDGYEAEWSMAKQQYEVLGEANINADEYGSTPADYKDLLCWSTTKNYYGVTNYYWRDDDVAAQYFQGDFVDWGTNPTLISTLGEGWSTLSKEEWNYLLKERKNAAKLQSFATISYLRGEEEKENVSVKGLILLPDDWTGDTPAGTFTAEEWATLEKDGAVFLPVTGHLWSYMNDEYRTQTDINGIDVIGNYWTSTQSTGNDLLASALNFNLNSSSAEPGVDIERRLGCAVRLVKVVSSGADLSTVFADGMSWATYVAEESLTTPEGLQAYVVSEATTTEVTATPVDYIPAGVGVLLNRADVNTTAFKAKPYKGEGESPVSLLVGSATTTTSLTPYQDFVLFDDEFMLSSTATIPAARAYLPAVKVPAGARKMNIVIGDATGIKSMRQLTIDSDAWYSLDGRRLNRKPAAKGVYIHHGSKVVIK